MTASWFIRCCYYFQVSCFEIATEVRAVVEGQFMAKRVHAENLGYALGNEFLGTFSILLLQLSNGVKKLHYNQWFDIKDLYR